LELIELSEELRIAQKTFIPPGAAVAACLVNVPSMLYVPGGKK